MRASSSSWYFSPVQIDDPAHLLEVIAGIGFHLGLRQLRPGFVAAGRIADKGRIIADNLNNIAASNDLIDDFCRDQSHG